MSATYFRAVKRKELENMGWTGSMKKSVAPSIVKMTAHFNLLANWVTETVLAADKIQTRLQVLSYFIHVANFCLRYDNILSGLQATPVHRLNRTWALVGHKERDMFVKLEQITSLENNNERYRQKLSSCKPPFVPYLGIHLSDLTYVWECIKKDKDNSERRAQYKERSDQFKQMLDEIAVMQSTCFYSFSPDYKFTDNLEMAYHVTIEDFKSTSETQYQISYKLEPRVEPTEPDQKKDEDWRGAATVSSSTFPKNFTLHVPGSFRAQLKFATGEPRHSEVARPSGATSTRRRPRLDQALFSPPAQQSSPSLSKDLAIATASETARSLSVKKRLMYMMGFGKIRGKNFSVIGEQDAIEREFSLDEGDGETTPIMKSKSLHRSYQPAPAIPIVTLTKEPQTVATSTPPEVNPPSTTDLKPPWEKSGKSRLQGLLYKREEFDVEGGRAIDAAWTPFWVILEGSTLSITPYEPTNTEVVPTGQLLIREFKRPEGAMGYPGALKKLERKDLGGSMFDLHVRTSSCGKPEPAKLPKSLMMSIFKRKLAVNSFLSLSDISSGSQSEPKATSSESIKSEPEQTVSLSGSIAVSKPSLKSLKIEDTNSQSEQIHASSTELSISTASAMQIPSETFLLDHLCRVTLVHDHKKRFVFRAMLLKQRSFLLRAANQKELEIWIDSLRS